MTTYAKCRDYREGESFPYLLDDSTTCLFSPCDESLYLCWQPDKLDDEEFNLVIELNGIPVRARGIHFDFEEI